MQHVSCRLCGREFSRHRHSNRTYCSNECKLHAMSIRGKTLRCKHAGRESDPTPEEIEERARRIRAISEASQLGDHLDDTGD